MNLVTSSAITMSRKCRTQDISADMVRHALSYDEESGVLQWKNPNPDSRGMAGKSISSVNSSGYVTLTINTVKYQAHRIIWLYMTGKMPEEFIDHINGIKTDNRFCNLRKASRSENGMNRKRNKSNLSGYKNVYPNKGGFLVRIRSNNKAYQRWFKNIEDAVSGAEQLRQMHHGEFKNSGEKS